MPFAKALLSPALQDFQDHVHDMPITPLFASVNPDTLQKDEGKRGKWVGEQPQAVAVKKWNLKLQFLT